MSRRQIDHLVVSPCLKRPMPRLSLAQIGVGSVVPRACRGVDHKDDPPVTAEADSSRLRPILPPSAGEKDSVACSRTLTFGHIPPRRGAGPPAIALIRQW